MGVFSKWHILERVEDRLDLQIVNNPSYPFVKDETDPNILVYKDRPPEFYISCVVSVCSVIIVAAWVSIALFSSMDMSQGIIFPIALLIYFLYRATQTIKIREYKVNVDAGWYKFYVGSDEMHRGKLHNFYFRLRERSSTGFPYYEIILNGYKISCVSISGFSKNIKKMRGLAKGMSKRLIINYYDCKDISPHHLVHWERPADISESSASLLEDEDSFEDNVMPQMIVPPLTGRSMARPRTPLGDTPELLQQMTPLIELPTIIKPD